MSIIIKGMEMPTKGNPLTVLVYPDGTATWKGREYEAVELPPHGDLIDRDEAIAVLKGLGDRKYRREKGTICEAEKMLQSSVYTPTIITAEREDSHGRNQY